ncbi:hypothetical protein I552_0016 [Mycobacterium xenopi 3993]|nr:hypothetical protein I552_0016 [Mycobacterium xenopi 3993]
MVVAGRRGVVIGALWAWIAPPIHGVVALTHEGERVHDYLGNEADHCRRVFDAGPVDGGGCGRLRAGVGMAGPPRRRWWSRCRSAWWAPQRPQPAGRAAGACALRRRRHRRSAADARAPGALLHRGAAVFFGPAAADRLHAAVAAATTALVYAFLVAAAVRDDLAAIRRGVAASPDRGHRVAGGGSR